MKLSEIQPGDKLYYEGNWSEIVDKYDLEDIATEYNEDLSPKLEETCKILKVERANWRTLWEQE